MTITQCTKCKKFHMGVTRDFALSEVELFNAHYNLLTKEKQDLYYGGKPSSITDYERCMYCGCTTFQEPTKECPAGVTLNPVIYPSEQAPAKSKKDSNSHQK